MFDFLANKFSDVFTRLTGQHALTEKNIDETLTKVKESLLEADVPFEVVNAFLAEVNKEVIGQRVTKSLKPGEQFIKIVHDKLVHFLSQGAAIDDFTFKTPSTVVMLGLQGSGKTTTLAKLAHFAQKKSKKPLKILCGSVDYYRPAAIDQLEQLARTTKIDFVRAQSKNVADAVRELKKYAHDKGYDLFLLDTAGRMHIDNALLQELRDIIEIVEPTYTLLVLDAMTGQESLRVAQAFNQAVGFDYAILSKMDSETRGGAAFAFRYTLKKAVLFAGIGERIEDLEQLKPDRMASRMIGMGDIKTLIERAEEKIKKADQQAMEDSFKRGNLTLEDFAKQMEMMGKLGSLGSVAKFIPGLGAQLTPAMIEQGEKEMRRFKAILSSMTPKERRIHTILDGSRKKRIAAGAGVAVSDINQLLDRFEKSQQFVKLFKKYGRMPGL